MQPCSHGMPTPLACITCMEDGNLPPTRKPPRTVVATFTAAYAGWCKECDTAINSGDRICKMSDDQYIHHKCV